MGNITTPGVETPRNICEIPASILMYNAATDTLILKDQQKIQLNRVDYSKLIVKRDITGSIRILVIGKNKNVIYRPLNTSNGKPSGWTHTDPVYTFYPLDGDETAILLLRIQDFKR